MFLLSLLAGIKPVLLNSSIYVDTCVDPVRSINCTEHVEEELSLVGRRTYAEVTYLLASVTFAALNISGFFAGLICDFLGHRNVAVFGVFAWMV